MIEELEAELKEMSEYFGGKIYIQCDLGDQWVIQLSDGYKIRAQASGECLFDATNNLRIAYRDLLREDLIKLEENVKLTKSKMKLMRG